jgi:hypothetical protein
MRSVIKNPEIISELKGLYIKKGILSPADVVSMARNPKSALHDSFEWDDSRAAEAYRIDQARGILQIVVEYLPSAPDIMSRVFISISDDANNGGGYRAMVDVLNDKDMRKTLVMDALNELQKFEHQYKAIKELVLIFSAIKKTRRRLGVAR